VLDALLSLVELVLVELGVLDEELVLSEVEADVLLDGSSL